MNLRKFSSISLVILLVIFNLILLINYKKEKKHTVDLIGNYHLKCSDEKKLISLLEKSYKFQGKQLVVNNDSLRVKLFKSSVSPLILIRQDVCTVCFDALLLELEKMRSDSLPLIKNLIAVQWSESNRSRENGLVNVFKSKNNAAYSIDRKELNILQENSFPDMLFVLVDKDLRILSFCEFSTSYPAIFLQELTFINSNYYL